MSYEPGQGRKQVLLREFQPGVPTYLREPLWSWVRKVDQSRDTASTVDLDERYALLFRLGKLSGGDLQRACFADEDMFLAVVEDLLANYVRAGERAILANLLEDAGSSYSLDASGDGLAWRVDPTTMSSVQRAAAEVPRTVSELLARSWNAAYERSPQVRSSYDYALLAVEAAYGPIVTPKDADYRLGKIISGIRDGTATGKFYLDIQDARPRPTHAEPSIQRTDSVLWMMRALSFGQKVRHGPKGEVINENTIEEVRVAVQLAVALVHFASTGAFDSAS